MEVSPERISNSKFKEKMDADKPVDENSDAQNTRKSPVKFLIEKCESMNVERHYNCWQSEG
jgi:hypothetical protein